MWFFRRKQPETARIELIEQVVELGARLKVLERTQEEALDEVSRRYRRAEQSELRLEKKKAAVNLEGDCIECEDEHPAILALKKRQGVHHAANTLNSGSR